MDVTEAGGGGTHLLGGGRHALLHHDEGARDVLLLHALAVHLDGLDPHLGLLCGQSTLPHAAQPRAPARTADTACLQLSWEAWEPVRSTAGCLGVRSEEETVSMGQRPHWELTQRTPWTSSPSRGDDKHLLFNLAPKSPITTAHTLGHVLKSITGSCSANLFCPCL